MRAAALSLALVASAALAAATPASAHDEATTGESFYTSLDFNQCVVLSEYENGAELECPGHNGAPLFITEGDLRIDVDVAEPNGAFFTINSWNYLGDTVEWRYGPPERGLRAVIVRYHFDTPDRRDVPSVLAVIASPTERRGSCYLALVRADAKPSQNEAARMIADLADELPCTDQQY